MNVIFQKKSFVLCDVPVPVGYPQSQTHAGIAYNKGNYYLVTSPYPNIRYKSKLKTYMMVAIRKLSCNHLCRAIVAERYENPCLYLGNMRKGNPPVTFELMLTRPLMEAPDPYYGLPAYNSDPDIFIKDDSIYILNRQVYRTKIIHGAPLKNEYIQRLFLIKGKLIDKKFKYLGTSLLRETCDLLSSPCLTLFKGKYRLFYLKTNSYNDGNTFNGLFMSSATTIGGLKRNSCQEKLKVSAGVYIPWHMSVFLCNDKLYAIVACVKKGEKQRCYQMFGKFSDDLSELKIYQTPLTDYKSYRGSACVREDELFVLYSTTVYEKLKCSKSVDGRDVIMASMPFNDLLKQLRNNE